jgi:hypothetical protein
VELVFGMPVIGRDDDEAGALDRVLVDSGRREVTHIVVKSATVSEDVLLALSLVQGNSDGRLLLHAATGDLANMPRYYEGRTSSTPAGRVDTAVVDEPAERRQDLERSLAVGELRVRVPGMVGEARLPAEALDELGPASRQRT